MMPLMPFSSPRYAFISALIAALFQPLLPFAIDYAITLIDIYTPFDISHLSASTFTLHFHHLRWTFHWAISLLIISHSNFDRDCRLFDIYFISHFHFIFHCWLFLLLLLQILLLRRLAASHSPLPPFHYWLITPHFAIFSLCLRQPLLFTPLFVYAIASHYISADYWDYTSITPWLTHFRHYWFAIFAAIYFAFHFDIVYRYWCFLHIAIFSYCLLHISRWFSRHYAISFTIAITPLQITE